MKKAGERLHGWLQADQKKEIEVLERIKVGTEHNAELSGVHDFQEISD